VVGGALDELVDVCATNDGLSSPFASARFITIAVDAVAVTSTTSAATKSVER
jgi:hypothetical protein